MMKQRKKTGILVGFLCLFCAVFLFSGYMLLSNMMKNRAAADAYRELRTEVQRSQSSGGPAATEKPAENKKKEEAPPVATVPPKPLVSMDFSDLQEINPEIIGWIRMEGSDIDYPIMQTNNNSYYLTHLYNREYNNNGSIFMDCRNSADFSDKNTVLYGHHMRNDVAMFASLKWYKDQEFYEANPTITLFTPEGDYLIELICGTVENGNHEFISFDFEDSEAFLSYIEEFRSRSTFTSDVEVQSGDQIVSLCTCSYEWENARYMVIGRLVRLYEAQ